MPAGVYNFTVEQGVTFTQDFYWTVNDSVVDLTGYTARMQVRNSAYSPDPPLVSWTSENGKIVLGTTNGKFTLTLQESDTQHLQWRVARYDIELISPAATPTITRVLKGKLTIDHEITK